MNQWTTLLGSGAIGVVLVAVVGLVGTLRTLRANMPVNDATADEKQAAANASNFQVQQNIIKTLDEQIVRQDAGLAKANARIAALEKQLEAMIARVEERDEQVDLMAEQLRTAQDEARTLRQHLALCQRSGQAMSDWMRTHYETQHPGEHPPVQQFRFSG